MLASSTRSKTKFLVMPFLCLTLLNLTACDYFNTEQKVTKFNQRPFEKTATTQLEETRELAKTATDEEGFSVEEISITKDGTPSGIMNASMNIDKVQDDIQQIKGLKTQDMFTVALSDDKERFIRLENAVQNLTNKINAMDPAITRLMEIDRDLNNITYQLEVLVKQSEAAVPKQPQYREARARTAPEMIAPASGGNDKASQPIPNSASTIIQNIRIGDHPDKTRIVFETSQKPQFTMEIDNIENLMMIGTGNSTVSFNPENSSRKSNLIDDIQILENGENTKLIFALSKTTEKINQGYIKPDASHPYHRMFIDLKR